MEILRKTDDLMFIKLTVYKDENHQETYKKELACPLYEGFYGLDYINIGNIGNIWNITYMTVENELKFLSDYGVIYNDIIQFFNKERQIYRIDNTHGWQSSFYEDLQKLLQDIKK